MNAIILAYSSTGNTAACARALSSALSAKFILLKEKRKRPEKDYFAGGMQSVFHLGSALQALPKTAEADVLIIGMPVWAGTTPPAINTLLRKLDCKGKTVFAFVTKADPATDAPEKLVSRLRHHIEKRGGTLKRVFALTTGEPLTEEAAKERTDLWAREISAALPQGVR